MVLVIMFCYALVWQQFLKGFDLTVAFANKAVVIVWGILFYQEEITWNVLFGAVTIIVGIWMVAKNEGY